MDIMGDGVQGTGGGGDITSFELFAIESVTGGAGIWNLTPTLPITETSGTPVVSVETLATDASADGSLILVFQAVSALGPLNWSLDLTQFVNSMFAPPEEWGVSIDSSDPTSPGECRVLLTMTSTDAFEEGVIFALLVDDGVNPPHAIPVTLNHTETP